MVNSPQVITQLCSNTWLFILFLPVLLAVRASRSALINPPHDRQRYIEAANAAKLVVQTKTANRLITIVLTDSRFYIFTVLKGI